MSQLQYDRHLITLGEDKLRFVCIPKKKKKKKKKTQGNMHDVTQRYLPQNLRTNNADNDMKHPNDAMNTPQTRFFDGDSYMYIYTYY